MTIKMTSGIVAPPSTHDLGQLADICREKANANDRLVSALKLAVSIDIDIAVETQLFRQRSTYPLKYWYSLRLQSECGLLSTAHSQGRLESGLYGPLIQKFAPSAIVGLDSCSRSQTAMLELAKASSDLAAWVARHIQPSNKLWGLATWELGEAGHLATWKTIFGAQVLSKPSTGPAS